MMTSSIANMATKTPQIQQKEVNRSNSTWSTIKVQELMQQIDDGYTPQITPFWEGSIDWRAPNIVFEHTTEEFDILKRCADDVVYFSDRYAYAMTDNGVEPITLRPYQSDVMRDFADNRLNVFLSPRQSGKCVDYCTLITIKNADTNEVLNIPIGRFYYQMLNAPDTFDKVLHFLNEARLALQRFKKVKLLRYIFLSFE